MQELYDLAFARLDRVSAKRQEFAKCWARYISVHPWDIDVRNADPCTLEILAVTREPAPVELALIFSEWLAALRASLDNAIYALASATTGQNPRRRPSASSTRSARPRLSSRAKQNAS